MVGCFVNGFIVVRCKLVRFSYVTIHTDAEMQISEASQFDPGPDHPVRPKMRVALITEFLIRTSDRSFPVALIRVYILI